MTYRTPLIAGNWKMFKTCNEAVETAEQLLGLIHDVEATDIIIAPTFTSLALVSGVIANSRIALGSCPAMISRVSIFPNFHRRLGCAPLCFTPMGK